MNAPRRLARHCLPLALAACLLVAGCSDDDDPVDDVVPDADVAAADGAGTDAGTDPDAAAGDDPVAADDLRRRATAIVRDVLDTVDGVAAEPVPMPDVVVETTPSLIYYQSGDDGTSVVVLPDWADLGDGERGLFEAWAGATGGTYDGRALFGELFNWFFVAHETGHLLQAVSDRGPATRQGEERQANEVAVAHFAATEPARLEVLVEALAAVRDTLPVPDGADDPAVFETEYDRIGEMPEVYGWYQFGFVMDAYARAEELDLARIARDDLGL